MCPGEIVKKSEVAWWTYAVTLDDAAYTKADADGAAVAVEYKMQAFMSDMMDCNRPGGRRLQEQLGIVGVDNLPDDVFQEGKCIVSVKNIRGTALSNARRSLSPNRMCHVNRRPSLLCVHGSGDTSFEGGSRFGHCCF